MNILALFTYMVIQANVSGWQTYKTLPQVDVLYSTEQCHDNVNGIHQEYMLLRFVNKTNTKLKLDWNYERYENGACSNCGNDEYKYSLVLEPNQTLQGTCGVNQKELRVFVKHLDLTNHKAFTKFELSNLTVSAL